MRRFRTGELSHNRSSFRSSRCHHRSSFQRSRKLLKAVLRPTTRSCYVHVLSRAITNREARLLLILHIESGYVRKCCASSQIQLCLRNCYVLARQWPRVASLQRRPLGSSASYAISGHMQALAVIVIALILPAYHMVRLVWTAGTWFSLTYCITFFSRHVRAAIDSIRLPRYVSRCKTILSFFW